MELHRGDNSKSHPHSAGRLIIMAFANRARTSAPEGISGAQTAGGGGHGERKEGTNVFCVFRWTDVTNGHFFIE
uniref:Uncharacterized protein n=1 Tax=Globodera rostochiensis TaxID=31243 RepID=A0A914IBQ6_GLORO